VKIRSIQAFAIRSDITGGPARTTARRPSWIDAAEVAGPMSRYTRFKRLRTSWRPPWPAVGCVVTAEDGSWGFGISRWGTPTIATINEHLAPLLVGENAMATEMLWDMMLRMVSVYGPSGLASYAMSAIDLALWDLKGRVLKRPVYELIGGPAREAITCYATGNDTEWHLELGFKATKLACPYGTADGLEAIDRDEALVARTRELIGPQVELMLDCWMAFDIEFTVRLAERLRPYRLKWIEDCLAPEEMRGWSELRRRLPWQTLTTGEHWYGTAPFADAAARHCVDIFQPDIVWAGGLTALIRIAHLAEAAGIAIIPHAGMNTPYGQHFSYAMPNAPWGEFFCASPPGVPLAELALFPGMAVPKDGRLVPNGGPGFGDEISLAAIEGLRA
jgi:L-rhamnonate dehydratase